MHLRHSTRLTWVVAGSGVIWLGIMVLFFFADYLSRNTIHEANREAQVDAQAGTHANGEVLLQYIPNQDKRRAGKARPMIHRAAAATPVVAAVAVVRPGSGPRRSAAGRPQGATNRVGRVVTVEVDRAAENRRGQPGGQPGVVRSQAVVLQSDALQVGHADGQPARVAGVGEGAAAVVEVAAGSGRSGCPYARGSARPK